MDGDPKAELKQEIATEFSAPDLKDKVVKFADVRAAFLKSARKEFGWVVEKIVAHEMGSMAKKKHLPEDVPVSKFAEEMNRAVDDGEVPAIGMKVMKEKVTPMLAEAFRGVPDLSGAATTQTAKPGAAAPEPSAPAASAPAPPAPKPPR